MLCHENYVDVVDLPDRLGTTSEGEAPYSLDEATRRHVRHVLGLVDGNKNQAAAALGISRGTIYRILAQGGDQS
jgi:transcriptional regulator of acetoin/glycerol metabolism